MLSVLYVTAALVMVFCTVKATRRPAPPTRRQWQIAAAVASVVFAVSGLARLLT